jgi:hypothetical protein
MDKKNIKTDTNNNNYGQITNRLLNSIDHNRSRLTTERSLTPIKYNNYST